MCIYNQEPLKPASNRTGLSPADYCHELSCEGISIIIYFVSRLFVVSWYYHTKRSHIEPHCYNWRVHAKRKSKGIRYAPRGYLKSHKPTYPWTGLSDYQLIQFCFLLRFHLSSQHQAASAIFPKYSPVFCYMTHKQTAQRFSSVWRLSGHQRISQERV